MSFKDLNKEQKQLVVLAVMAVVVVVALGNQLVLGPAKENAANADKMISEKGKEKTLGIRMLNRDPNIQENLGNKAVDLLTEQAEGRIPPRIGKEFWAQKRLTDIGYNLGMSLTVSEHGALRHIPLQEKGDLEPGDVSFWVPYAVEINTQAGYNDLLSFIHQVHEQEPYASLARLQIAASEKDPLRHDILMIYEWPTPRFEEDVDMLTGYAEAME